MRPFAEFEPAQIEAGLRRSLICRHSGVGGFAPAECMPPPLRQRHMGIEPEFSLL
jgi:hypothetical protein